MELSLVQDNDPILKKEARRFDFDNPPFDIMEFSKALVLKMREHNGMGLAAPQVGHPYQIFCMEGEPATVVINPRVVEYSKETVLLEEGCLSYPGLLVKVTRPKMVKVRFSFPDGYTSTHTYDGISARCFLHEFDHLAGVCHITRAGPIHREQANRRWKIIKKRNKSVENLTKLVYSVAGE